MNSVFKKSLALSVALVAATAAITPRNADAAWMVGYSNQEGGYDDTVDTVSSVVFLTCWVTALGAGITSAALNDGSIAGPWAAIAGIAFGVGILEADGSIPTSGLEKALNHEFPFIDNAEVVSNLAIQMKEQAKNTAIVDGKQIVRLDAATVKNILAPAFLSDAQVEQVAAKLQ